mgnify:CR=1 FL=1
MKIFVLPTLTFAAATAGIAGFATLGRANPGDKRVPVDFAKVKADAFALCQGPFRKPQPEAIPMLDPPTESGVGTLGMIYQEELAVRARANLLDQKDFYVKPLPRAAVNQIPMEVFVDPVGDGRYEPKTWADANFDYGSPDIQPPIDREKIPEAGRVLTEVIVGHRAPDGGYPQLFDFRSSAYVRFAGYPPQITGASLRLGAHGIFSQGASPEQTPSEDFPVLRRLYMTIKDNRTAHAYGILENELFCAALDIEMLEGAEAKLTIDNAFYFRKDHKWKEDPHTALVAYSSMLWKTEKHTPEHDNDEAHDSDTLVVKYADGQQKRVSLDQPDDRLRVQEFPSTGQTAVVQEWELNNEDRDPAHYAHFAPALGSTNYDKRVSYRVRILESNAKTAVTLYESNPDGEYGDNIVAASTLRQDVAKSKDPSDFVRFKYETTAFYPEAAPKK